MAKDAEKAVHWLTEATDQDLSFAQYTLGCLYLKGEEISKDMENEDGKELPDWFVVELFRDLPRLADKRNG